MIQVPILHNMFLLVAFGFLLGSAVGSATAQPPHPCCAPEQFTLRYDQIVTTQKGYMPIEIREESLEAAYDYINATVGMEIAIRPLNKTEQKIRVVQNFSAGYQWVMEGSHCIKQPLTPEDQTSRCIPPGSVYEGSFTIGLEGLKVSTWLINAGQSNSIHGHQRYTVTDYMCTPVNSAFVGTMTTTTPPTQFVNSGSYMNFKDHIQDPARWFHLPPSCLNATVMPVSHEHFGMPRTPYIRLF